MATDDLDARRWSWPDRLLAAAVVTFVFWVLYQVGHLLPGDLPR